MRTLATRLVVSTSVSMGLLLVGAGVASATTPTVDYTQVETPVENEITNALPVALTLLGIVAAILLGIAFFRKVTGAKKVSG